MLQVIQLTKSFGDHQVLAGISFIINQGEHVGLIGGNGAGKTTLLRCIVGELQPDSGSITLPPGATLGYLQQAFAEIPGLRVADVLDTAQAGIVAAERRLQAAAERLAEDASDEAMAAYDAALAAWDALGGYEREHRAEAVLHGLELGAVDTATPVAELSGGQKTRLGLAALLLREPELLLLDEPTNHLDADALLWLEDWLRGYRRAALIVSHDRAFLDRTVTRILAFDGDSHTLRSYEGGYSEYAATRAHEQELQAEAYKKQQEYVGRVMDDIRRLKGNASTTERRSTPNDRDAKFALDNKTGAAKLARQARARERKLERYLESEERVEKPRQRWGTSIDLGAAPAGGRAVLRVEDLSFGYGKTPLLRDVSFEIGWGERVALVGPNGAGKTTLLRLIEGRLVPDCGSIRLGAGIRLGVMSQEGETLNMAATVLESVLAERAMAETEARAFLHRFLFGGDSVFRRVAACSPGERARLQLALLVLRGCNLLLLDEPLNHLDIEGREQFEHALAAFDGTIVCVAHDRAFLEAFAGRTIDVRGGRIRVYHDFREYQERIDV